MSAANGTPANEPTLFTLAPSGRQNNNKTMANTYVSNILHIVFHTKSGGTTIAAADLKRVHQYIGGIVKGTGSTLIEIGGMPDHIHLLASLPKTTSLSDFVRTIKADSSRWIKGVAPRYERFAWQEGYGAFSVSASVVPKVVQYIRNQERHHKSKTFVEEYKSFMEAYGIDYDERYL